MNTKKLTVLILLLVGLKCTDIHAQAIADGVPVPQVVPPTPQTQMFENYINHAITEYNGLPVINIPLYTIEIKGMKIPISLSYHAGGIKYKSYDGDIGAGWSLNAGGFRVSRTIYGQPDELYPLYDASVVSTLSGDRQAQDGYLASIGLPEGTGYASIIMNNYSGPNAFRDGEYDQFNYMLPSTGGQFIITNRTTKAIDMANANQDQVVLDEGSPGLSLDNIKIVDNSGFIYHMGGMQGGVPLIEKSRSNTNFKTAWPVSQIQSPYNENVDFKYDLINVNMSAQNYFTYQIDDAATLGSFAGSPFLGVTNFSIPEPTETFLPVEQMYYIKEIKTAKETVTFTRLTGSQVLSKVVVTNPFDSKQLEVDFSYVTSGDHQLLSGVTVNGKAYALDYYDPPADVSQSFPDQWNYYKYPNTGSDYDGLYFHQEFLDHQYVQSVINPGLSTVKTIAETPAYFLPKFVDRTTNETPFYYSLKKITFPTGGTTDYEYEPNQYKVSSSPGATTIKGCGQRIKTITSRPAVGALGVITQFKYGLNEDGNGTVDYDYMSNIKYRFYNEIASCSITSDPGNPFVDLYSMNTVRTYSSAAIESDIELNNPVQYAKVTTYQYDELHNQFNGKTISTYDIPDNYQLTSMDGSGVSNGGPSNDASRGYSSAYFLGREPTLTSRQYYNNSSQLVKQEDYTYTYLSTPLYEGLKVKQKVFFNNYPGSGTSVLKTEVYSLTDSYFQTLNTHTVMYGNKVASQTTSVYTNGATPVVTTEANDYNPIFQLVKTTTSNSIGGSLVKDYTYPAIGSAGIYGTMASLNMVSPVIKQITTNNGNQVEVLKTNYTNDPAVTTGLILPQSVQTSYTGEANLFTNLTYDKYDSKGNVLQLTKANGPKTSFLWSYNYLFPVAQVTNASYADIAAALLTAGLDVNDLAQSLAPDLTKVNALRTNATFKNSLISTFTYEPLSGVISTTDPKGQITYYEYDGLRRLYRIKDKDLNIVKQFCYNYAGQTTDCTVPYVQPAPPGGGGGHGTPCTGEGQKTINGVCETGTKYYTSSVQDGALYTCTYHYIWSDNSISTDYTESSHSPCTLGGVLQ